MRPATGTDPAQTMPTPLVRTGPSPVAVALTLALSVAAVAWWLTTSSGAHLLHFDAKAHLLVSRRVFDSLTPGWTQLGAIWLPLPHILNAIPARSDFLYETGLFASGLGFVSFALGLWALGAAAARGARDAWAGAVAIAVPALNPGWLYLQATPMTEPLFLGLVCGLAFFLVRWVQAGRPRDLILASVCSGLACLVRYEAWPIAALALVVAFWKAPAHVIRRWLPLATGIGLVGPIVFFGIHSWVATERAFYVIDSGNLTERGGDAMKALELLASGTADGFGVPLLAAAVAALAVGAFRPDRLFGVALALTGTAAVTLTAYLAGHPTKARYPLLLAPAFALALAAATRGKRVCQAAAIALAATQPVMVGPPLPVLREAVRDRHAVAARRPGIDVFRREYHGGRILASMGSLAPVLFETRLPLHEFVHEGNGHYWEYAAVDPARYVSWVLIAPGDVLDEIRQYRPRFPEGFVPVREMDRVILYARPPGAADPVDYLFTAEPRRSSWTSSSVVCEKSR